MAKKTVCLVLLIGSVAFLLGANQTLASDYQTIPTPANLSVFPTVNGFLLSWSSGAVDAVYKVYWANDASVSEVNYVGVLATGNTAYEHAGLVPGLTYYYRVMACSCECSPLSNLASAAFDSSPGEVYNLSGTVTFNGAVIQPGGTDPMVMATVRATELTGANLGNSVSVNPDGTYQLVGKATGRVFTFKPVMGSDCTQDPSKQGSSDCHACHAVER